MEEYEDDFKGETPENIGLYINRINYSYSIYKSDYDKKYMIQLMDQIYIIHMKVIYINIKKIFNFLNHLII